MAQSVLRGLVAGCALMAASVGAVAQAGSVAVVSVELKNSLDSKKAKIGDAVVVSLRKPAHLSDGRALPAGALVAGKVTAVTPSAKGTDGSVSILFDTMQISGAPAKVQVTLRGVSPAAGDGEGEDEVKLGALSMGGDAVGTTGAEHGSATLKQNQGKSTVTTGGSGSRIKDVDLAAGDGASASGVFTGKGKNVKLDEGTVMTVVVVTQ